MGGASLTARLLKIGKWGVVLIVVIATTFLGIRIYDAQSGPPLELWHKFVPPELRADELETADWQAYLAAEEAAFDGVHREVTEKLTLDERTLANRFIEGSPINPTGFAQDWNRSYTLDPVGEPVGAVVLLHGLTDSPYSLRHIARQYRDNGFAVVAIRLPGHGTVPAGLADIEWQDWVAATQLAVREARQRIEPDRPVHLVGFSNGGALALKYALDGIEGAAPSRPDRLVLISPMIGITRFARFAGLAGLPALLPTFAKAAWLGIVPEFNPFKYNSFPVNGAQQSWSLTQALQEQILRVAADGRMNELPPTITFQSVADFTVSTSAIISSFYVHLPENGHELVLFDVNRDTKLGTLLRVASSTLIERLLPDVPRDFRTTVIANAAAASSEVVARTVEAGETEEQVTPLDLAFPAGVFSLSHVALPFPLSDSLYGLEPDQAENFGVNLGAIAPRGERGALIISLDSLLRMSSNPFFEYLIERIVEGIDTTSSEAASLGAR